MTTPVNSLLTCSTAPCGVETSTNFWSLQFGQSAQPRPEPVRRTAAPVTTIRHTATSAAMQTLRYVAGVIACES